MYSKRSFHLLKLIYFIYGFHASLYGWILCDWSFSNKSLSNVPKSWSFKKKSSLATFKIICLLTQSFNSVFTFFDAQFFRLHTADVQDKTGVFRINVIDPRKFYRAFTWRSIDIYWLRYSWWWAAKNWKIQQGFTTGKGKIALNVQY